MKARAILVVALGLFSACAYLTDNENDNDDGQEVYIAFDDLSDSSAVAEVRSTADDSVLATLRWDHEQKEGLLEMLDAEDQLSLQGVALNDQDGIRETLRDMYKVHRHGLGDGVEFGDTDEDTGDGTGVDVDVEAAVVEGDTHKGRGAQRIDYVDRITTTDFRGAGMGKHLEYWPAFGLATQRSDLRTNGPGTIERTRDFANFTHHSLLPNRRTFSPDAGGSPIGVKTAGGRTNWDTFTLPDGRKGRSGVVYDLSICRGDNNGGSNNFVNQFRTNTRAFGDEGGFCLNLITDNTKGEFDPKARLEARSDVRNLRVPNSELKFDGRTDMYTFKYTGIGENDRVKIRIQSRKGCRGAGLAGIMVSDLSTCDVLPIGRVLAPIQVRGESSGFCGIGNQDWDLRGSARDPNTKSAITVHIYAQLNGGANTYLGAARTNPSAFGLFSFRIPEAYDTDRTTSDTRVTFRAYGINVGRGRNALIGNPQTRSCRGENIHK